MHPLQDSRLAAELRLLVQEGERGQAYALIESNIRRAGHTLRLIPDRPYAIETPSKYVSAENAC
jgi:hypothetical protein